MITIGIGWLREIHRYTTQTDLQSEPKVNVICQKWMYLFDLVDSGVMKLVGGVSYVNICDNISSVT
jgi:hypothetical protein